MVDLCAPFQEDLHHLGMSAEGREAERRGPALLGADGLDLRAAVQEQADQIGVALLGFVATLALAILVRKGR